MVKISRKENGKPLIHIDCMDAMLFGAIFCVSGLLINSELWFHDFTLRVLVCSNLLMVARSFHRWFGFVIIGFKGGEKYAK